MNGKKAIASQEWRPRPHPCTVVVPKVGPTGHLIVAKNGGGFEAAQQGQTVITAYVAQADKTIRTPR